MTSAVHSAGRPRVRRLNGKYVPVLGTLSLLIVMFAVGSAQYIGFGDPQVVLNLFIDNGFLLVVAIGMTFVILTGGIDLSVGSVVALSTMVSASLIEHQGWPAYAAMLVALLIGAVLGFAMGCIIHYFEIQPFIVTLAGMFLARGLCYMISLSSISIDDPTYTKISESRVGFGGYELSYTAVVALVVLLIAGYVLHYTRLGRNVYAVGGNEQSALLMGLPVARTKIAVYTISGLCSALGGVLFSIDLHSGYGLHALGLELDAIAAVVIGGTLLSGGSGYLIGTLFGVMILGLIQTIISFQGTLTSWWTKIFIGVLLLVFILLQRLIGARRT